MKDKLLYIDSLQGVADSDPPDTSVQWIDSADGLFGNLRITEEINGEFRTFLIPDDDFLWKYKKFVQKSDKTIDNPLNLF